MKYVRITFDQADKICRLAHDENDTFVPLDKQTLENGDVLILIAERKKNGYIFINWVSKKRYEEMISESLPF